MNHYLQITGTNSVQLQWKASMASTVDLESVPDTQHGIPRGEATPAEQKFAVYGNTVAVSL